MSIGYGGACEEGPGLFAHLYCTVLYCTVAVCEEGPGLFAHLLTLLSLLIIILTLPVSLVWVVKVVQVLLLHQHSISEQAIVIEDLQIFIFINNYKATYDEGLH